MSYRSSCIFSFFVGCFVVFGCRSDNPAVVKTSSGKNVLKASAPIGGWVPPAPVAPGTYQEGLGFVTLDKSTAYTVHAVAADRASLYALFPDDAKYRAVNASYVWYWGDGGSSVGPQADHVYQRAGRYFVQCMMDVGFRGGSVSRVTAGCMAEVVPLRSAPVLSVTPPGSLKGTSGSEPEVVDISVTNTGGQEAICRPKLVVKSGTIDDISWMSISPVEAIVPNNGVPVVFHMNVDWPHASSVGDAEIGINCECDIYSRGWYLKFVSGVVLPG